MVKLKYIFPVFLCMIALLTGCTQATKTDQYKVVYVPTYIVPTPPKVERPVLYVSTMTDAQKNDIGEVAKGLTITATQLKQYSCLLEKIVDKYSQLALAPASPTAPTLTLTADEQKECLVK